MKCWFAIAPCAVAMASCALNAAPRKESIRTSISLFEKEVQLPEGSVAIERYARFYKVVVFKGEKSSKSNTTFVEFVYIHRDIRAGIYIFTDTEDIPYDNGLSGGGCSRIYGVFRLRDRKLINIECGPLL